MTFSLLVELLPFSEAAREQLLSYDNDCGVSSFVDELRMLFYAHEDSCLVEKIAAETTEESTETTKVTTEKIAVQKRQNRDECWEQIGELDDALQFYLYFCTKLVAEAEVRYSERFGYDAYLRIARDLVRWSNSCHRRNGVYGLEEYRWFERMLDLSIVELGILQFEFTKLSILAQNEVGREIRDAVLSQRPDAADDVVKVHIPAGVEFSSCRIQESFIEAWERFGTSCAYICHSWLLDPALAELLPEGSNILYFQKLFDLGGRNYCAPQAENLLFLRASSHLEDYRKYLASIEASSLQKKALAYLEAGNKLGLGIGVLKG